MNESDLDTENAMEFYERYAGYSNQQIKEILKNHKSYQDPAVTAAVKIAIERELIHTEQDLMGTDYQSTASEGWTLFPEIPMAQAYKKLVASIFRVLFLTSIIPIIFGVMKYAEGHLAMTYLGVGLGLTWMLLTFILFKTEKLAIIFIQVIMVISAFVILGNHVLGKEIFPLTDVFVLLIGTLLLLYFLFYLKKLIQTKPAELLGEENGA